MIALKKVTKIYPGNIVALKDVNLDIKPKEFVCLVGPSGAGKSTLIKLMIREDVPTAGQVFISGTNVSALSNRQVPYLRRKIGVVYQDFKLLPTDTVFENVAFAMEVSGKGVHEIDRIVPRILKLVGLLSRQKDFPEELSGGERQRVAIARALVHQPKILIADEPTGNLDPKTAWEIVQLLTKINEFGTTVIMATHNKEVVDKLRRRVITLEKGRVVYDKESGRYML